MTQLIPALQKIPRWLLIALIMGVVLGAVATFVQPLLMLGAIAGVLVAFLIVRSPFAGVLLVALLLPLERLGAYESAYGTVRMSQVVALLTVFLWFLARP